MSKYFSGLDFASACQLDKDRIKMALNGQLVVDENEEGFVYANASKEDCDAFIVSCYDEAVYQALTSMAAGRAMEDLYARHCGQMNFIEFAQAFAEEMGSPDCSPYVYDSESENNN